MVTSTPPPKSQTQPPDIFTVHVADARQTDSFLAGVSQHVRPTGEPFLSATVTSPPYANLVDYGPKNQIGFGQSYATYLEECKAIFGALFKWTKTDGVLWLVADTLVIPESSASVGRLVPLPFDLARVAEGVGWTLREVVIWRKDRTLPWSHKGKMRNGFEYVLLLVKSKDYKYDLSALRSNRNLAKWWVKFPERHNPWGAAPENVWTIPIPVQGSWASAQLRHACPFPEELVRRALEITTLPGDIVFDPFSGSGTVAAVAEATGRRPLGTELNAEFVEAYAKRYRPEIIESLEKHDDNSDVSDAMTASLLKLRAIKFPRELVRQLGLDGLPIADIHSVVLNVKSLASKPTREKYGVVDCTLVARPGMNTTDVEALHAKARERSGKAPLSTFSLETNVRAISYEEALIEFRSKTFYRYDQGRTWKAVGTAAVDLIGARVGVQFPPILSNLEADFDPE